MDRYFPDDPKILEYLKDSSSPAGALYFMGQFCCTIKLLSMGSEPLEDENKRDD